ncbi:flagellar hook-length control protein FliK [Microvirga rosea]|uniref:flagellar hook-length control protein FliK n=1 Tax=Microvirga rosea TaxID=2715425 RepID=UPI001D0A5A8A|nr:flagellar hook-length control protein FliK [Microvirga rosea]MCB8823545.1 flagellar hook-length control protein FliK [Microvirga rosea]
MSKLEFILQNAARRIESQTYKSANPDGFDKEGQNPQGTAEAADFDALLKTLSSKQGESDVQGRKPLIIADMRETHLEIAKMNTLDVPEDPDGSVPAPDVGSQEIDPNAREVNDIQFNQFVFSVQSQPTQGASGRNSSAAEHASSLLEKVIPRRDDSSESIHLKTSSATVMKASVLHQEAHFKPVVSETSLPRNFDKELGSNELPIEDGSSPQLAASIDETAEKSLVKKSAFDDLAGARKEAVSSSAPTQPETTGSSSHLSNLQRIANAVVADAVNANSAQHNVLGKGISDTGSIVIKPSDGVLRILNIQLHPVELGVVTVKMRLSGDNLEMELHTDSNETADILRKDTDKLSSLLRGSGYRPDIITIHVTGVDASQEASMEGRQSLPNQTSSGGFQQNQAGQDEQPRQLADETGNSRGRGRNNENDEASASARGAGGVYL